jgi:hypothetical protein
MTRILAYGTFALWFCSLLGCGGDNAGQSRSVGADAAPLVDRSQYLLSDEPEGAVGVITARENATDGEPVVLVARIGGRKNPWIEGRAAFTVIDASMAIVTDGAQSDANEVCMDDCCAALRNGCTTLVKLVDQQQRVLPVDARELLQAGEGDMVVVQGQVKRASDDEFSIVASGVYVRR